MLNPVSLNHIAPQNVVCLDAIFQIYTLLLCFKFLLAFSQNPARKVIHSLFPVLLTKTLGFNKLTKTYRFLKVALELFAVLLSHLQSNTEMNLLRCSLLWRLNWRFIPLADEQQTKNCLDMTLKPFLTWQRV